MTEHLYRTHGVCARTINFELDEDNNIHNVSFYGGCNGNLKGIGSLVEGMPAAEVAKKIAGTRCGGKTTSCPDQLARAIQEALEQ